MEKTKIKQPILLVITDGIGHSENHEYNAFSKANKPTYDKLFKTVPFGYLKTSGLAVGLPDGQMGNSEVGHMTIGAGRVLFQNLVKISKAIEDGSLEKSTKLQKFLHRSSSIHIIALISDGGVHSHVDHVLGLIEISRKSGKKVWLHMITDGRDVSPTSSKSYLGQILEVCDEQVRIASIGGRFYSMDRDNRWERTKKGIDVMLGNGQISDFSVLEYVDASYSDNITDEFIEPTFFTGFEGIKYNDGLLFANFRNDRMRQIVRAFWEKRTGETSLNSPDVNILTMTSYDDSFPFDFLFTSDILNNTLPQIISRNNLSQFHTAETEKYPHVTFFFNGGKEESEVNETRILVPSPKVLTYDLQPSMSAPMVADVVSNAIDDGYDFIVVNFANGDMVGHTGNFDAAVEAVESVDKALGQILPLAEKKGYGWILTSDHGNCESMMDDHNEILTNHTTFDVYCFIKAINVKNVSNGGLSQIASTVLDIMGLDIPQEIDKSLIKKENHEI